MYKQDSLFDDSIQSPLAERMRPQNLDEFIGQEHIIGKGKSLRNQIEQDMVTSMIFWGPPGVGKTTLAKMIAKLCSSCFYSLTAGNAGTKEVKEVIKEAQNNKLYGKKTILFIDEIHRFNKMQQDCLLQDVEKGNIILIGATTENPSFEVNSALLSRARVYVLKALNEEDIIKILKNALQSSKGFGKQSISISDDILKSIALFSSGDARKSLNLLETVVINSTMEGQTIKVDKKILEECINNKMLIYDKKGEEHYNIISALHKSMRNSDVNAALYYLARMFEAGEDPLYIARRLIRFASEDIGVADYRALQVATNSYQACHFIGRPECDVNLAEAVVYLSLAPKSNSIYKAYLLAKEDAKRTSNEPVPLQIRNASTKLMKTLGYGENYKYAHDYKEGITNMQCMIDKLKDRIYYEPTENGDEKLFKKKYDAITKWKENKK